MPHRDHDGAVHHVTFRLADSLPASVVARWKEEIADDPAFRDDRARQQQMYERVQRFEDAGHGKCQLRRPEIAVLVREALLRFDGERYRLAAWCIMPNHVHVLLRQTQGVRLGEIVGSWKKWTARRANQILGRDGRFWMRDFRDRAIRSARHWAFTLHYIESNPVKAGLCRRPEDWRWGSAWERARKRQC